MLFIQNNSIKFKGFTLIELMVSIVISSIIMLGVVSVYSSSRKGQKINESVARVQENLRFAADMMTRDIRMAGYSGCKSSSVSNVLQDTESLPYKYENAVTGFEAGSTFPSPFPAVGTTAGLRVAGTDAIAIIRVSSTGFKITGHNAPSATISVDAAAAGIEEDDILVVTDCNHSAIFRVTGPANLPANDHINHNTGNVGDGPENCSKFLGPIDNPGNGCAGTNNTYSYNDNARVHKYIMHAYYLGISSSGKTKSLYIIDLDKGLTSATELVEGIEDLQVTYGVDPNIVETNNPFPVRFVKASNIAAADIPKIVAVKFGMLLSSTHDAKSSDTVPKPYTLSDTTVTPTVADKKLHFSYNTTVKIRNKGIR